MHVVAVHNDTTKTNQGALLFTLRKIFTAAITEVVYTEKFPS